MAGIEAQLQGKIIRWLKAKGCVVVKLQAGPAVPVGMPDVLALIDGGGWIALEVKASAKSKFQPLQKEWVKKLDEMYYARIVYPENWEKIKLELVDLI